MAAASERSGMTEGALAGLRIIDLCWVMAGPQATRILADFGAEVIKVESRSRLDMGRVIFGPHVGERGIDNSGYFNNFNRNKRSVSLNMSRPEGREIFGRLAAISDGVVRISARASCGIGASTTRACAAIGRTSSMSAWPASAIAARMSTTRRSGRTCRPSQV